MFSGKEKVVKIIKVSRTQNKSVLVVDPSEGQHMLGLSKQVKFLYDECL